MTPTTIIYSGARLNSKGQKVYSYVPLTTANEGAAFKEEVWFKKKLIGFERIGACIDAEVHNGTSYRNCQIRQEFVEVDADLITMWSAKERTALDAYQWNITAKKDHPASVNDMIKRLKDNMYHLSRKEQLNLARYIFEKLIT